MENPVFINELRQSPFRRKLYQWILLWIAACAVIIFCGDYIDPRMMFFWMPIIVLPVVVPTFTAGLFAREYEQQTWQDMALTRLTNAQVVIGKFLASFLQVGAVLLMLLPPIYYDMITRRNELGAIWLWDIVVYLFKLMLSTTFYIMLAMVCSRYSSNRRTSLIWCYITLFLYALLESTVWNALGLTFGWNPQSNNAAEGYMQQIHLLISAVVGIGGGFLLWVSLSEQRGYHGSGTGVSRGWQPIDRGELSKETATK